MNEWHTKYLNIWNVVISKIGRKYHVEKEVLKWNTGSIGDIYLQLLEKFALHWSKGIESTQVASQTWICSSIIFQCDLECILLQTADFSRCLRKSKIVSEMTVFHVPGRTRWNSRFLSFYKWWKFSQKHVSWEFSYNFLIQNIRKGRSCNREFCLV